MANPSPICEVKEGSGAWQSTADGVDVTAGSSLTIRLVDTSAYAWSIECIGTDETNDLVTVNAGLSVTTTTKQATLTAPASAGSALIFRSTVNGGFSTDGTARASYSTTFKISVPTSNGSRVGAVGETTENDSNFGFAPIINGLVRTISGLVSGTATRVIYGETISVNDMLCSANGASNTVLRATAANLANGGKVRGMALEAGLVGETHAMAGPGTEVAAATAGISAGSTADTITLNTTTAKCVRNPTPAPTSLIVGKCSVNGNVTIDPIHPGIGTWIDNLSHVSLLDYGADPTGVASSSTALTNAHANAIATGKKLLIPAGSYKLTSNFTITAECEAIGQFTGSVTLTIAGPFRASRKQVFAAALTVTFTDYVESVDEVYPEWFGAKGDGVAFTGSITSGLSAITASSASFTSADVGKYIAIYTPGTALVFASTVASYTDSTHVSAVGTAGSTFTSKSGIIATDDRAAIVRANIAARGRVVSFAPGKIYGVASSVALANGTGRGWRLRGRSTIQAVAAFSGGVLSNDPGTDTAANVVGVSMDGLTIIGSNLAQDGLVCANWAYPNRAAGFVGDVKDVTVTNTLRFGVYAHACQESHWANIRTSYTGSRGFTAIACNAMTVSGLTIAICYGSAADGMLIDAWPNNASLTAGTFTADASSDVVTHTGKIYPNETRVQLTTTGTLPTGLSLATDYWTIRTGAPGASTTSRLATSRDNVRAGVYVDITSAGTGTHTMTPQAVSGSSSYGGGDIFVHGLTIETVTGNHLVIRDENGVSGSVVKISAAHLEGGTLDGVVIDRQGTVIEGLSASGPGSGAYYPVHLTANAHGSRVRGVVASSYTSIATLVDAGCTNTSVAANFSASTKVWVDPVYSGGWSSRSQEKLASGDRHHAGRLGLGTLTPRERLDVALGGANIGRGSLVLDHGQLRSPWGGVGQGMNLLQYSQDYSNAFWTGGKGTACTMTNNDAVAPDGTTTACLMACWGATATQRFNWGQGDIYTYLGFTDLENGDTTNGVNYVYSVWLKASGKDESGNAYVADGSGGSATVLVDTTLGVGVATDGHPAGFSTMGLAVGDPVFNATERIVTWIVSVDSNTQLTLTNFGVNVDTGAMTAVSNWNGDTYIPPQKCALQLNNGNGTSMKTANITVDWAWRSYDIGANTVAYPADNTKKPRCGVYYHSSQYPYSVHRWEDQLEIVATGAPLRPGPVVHVDAFPVAKAKRLGTVQNTSPTANPAYGQQVFWLKLAIAFGTADATVLYTVPAEIRGLFIHRAFWETGTAWTGGAASAIGVSSDDANYSTKGDLLGGAGGDVAATLTANRFTGGTVGAKFGSNGVVVLAAGKVIRFDRIVSAFTAGTGFVWLKCSALP